MASILDRYGIKEVADVTFYEIDKETNGPGKPVLYLDTLKVSTIEQTAENTSARGGKGNPELITWDYNKEVNVTLEDALFSPKSMAIMYGDVDGVAEGTGTVITKTIRKDQATVDGSTVTFEFGGKPTTLANAKGYDKDGNPVDTLNDTKVVYYKGTITATGSFKIDINPDKFPGNYYVTGDTYARSEADGTDAFFQFIMPKVKILSENTLTMEAEGDPTVFNMNLKVLKPASGPMMQLVQYTIEDKKED